MVVDCKLYSGSICKLCTYTPDDPRCGVYINIVFFADMPKMWKYSLRKLLECMF